MRKQKTAGIKYSLIVMAASAAPLLAIGTASAAMDPGTSPPGEPPNTCHGRLISAEALNGGRHDRGLKAAADFHTEGSVMALQQMVWDMSMMGCMM